MSVSQVRPPNSQARPLGMPKYPNLQIRKRELLSDMLWMERSLIGGDFHYYSILIKSKKELKEINEELSRER